ncbi:MAG: hypothetical protein IRZ03_14770 [Acidobacterium ailaaui]|nr:hypothetical protein [Pseudacidobacterium ailaaui]
MEVVRVDGELLAGEGAESYSLDMDDAVDILERTFGEQELAAGDVDCPMI